MQENKFEDQVRKTMDRLSLDPDDTVWENVKKGIGDDEKRRKPLFWIFLIATPLILGGGYFILNGHSAENVPALSPDKAVAVQLKPSPMVKTYKIHPDENPIPDKLSQKRVSAENKPVLMHPPATLKLISGKQESNRKETPSDGNSERIQTVEGSSEPAETSEPASAVKTKKTPVPASSAAHPDRAPEIPRTAESKKESWKIGYTAGFGASDIHQGGNSQSAVNFPPYSGGSGTSGPTTSTVYPGFSWSAGVFAGRKLSSRLFISGGLNYHYFSNRVIVGDLLNYGPSYLTYFGQSYATAYSSNNSGHSYTNQYHFVELPVLVDYSLNKSNKVPLIWEAGFSFAWMVSNTALYFNHSTDFYYKNSTLFNEAQWNVSTALLVGLSHQQIFVGPQFQYGLSSLFSSLAPEPQHLFSYGIKITFIPHGK